MLVDDQVARANVKEGLSLNVGFTPVQEDDIVNKVSITQAEVPPGDTSKFFWLDAKHFFSWAL